MAINMSESEYKRKLVIAEAERDHHKKWSNNYEQALDDAQQNIKQKAEEIKTLKSLISELLPYMLNDMEQGLHLGQPPFEQDHCKDKDILCGDCQWFEDATLWKNRVDAGEFKDYM